MARSRNRGARARRGITARAHSTRTIAYGYFAAADSLIVTGPTRTNVNDYRAILVT